MGSNPGPLDCKAFYINQFMCRIVHSMLFCTYCVRSYGQKCLDNLDGPNVNDAWMTKSMDVVRMGIGTWDILKCRFQNIPKYSKFF